jgi:hypothetical protein
MGVRSIVTFLGSFCLSFYDIYYVLGLSEGPVFEGLGGIIILSMGFNCAHVIG